MYTLQDCKLLMNKLFWKYFSEHEENCFLLFLQYLYENASDGISCRNEAAFILITLNKILIKSSQTASNQCCNLISIRNSIPIWFFFFSTAYLAGTFWEEYNLSCTEDVLRCILNVCTSSLKIWDFYRKLRACQMNYIIAARGPCQLFLYF